MDGASKEVNTLVQATTPPEEVIDADVEDGECENCGRPGLLSRIGSRLSSGETKVCWDCLDAYRRGDTTIAGIVVPTVPAH